MMAGNELSRKLYDKYKVFFWTLDICEISNNP